MIKNILAATAIGMNTIKKLVAGQAMAFAMLGGTLGEPFVQPAAHADPGQLCTPMTVGDRSESGAVSPAMVTTSSPPPSATTSGCNEEADLRGQRK